MIPADTYACGVQVVDVGGGTGFCTQGIVKTVSPTNVTLLDQSPHQLDKAKKKDDLQGITIVEVQYITSYTPMSLVYVVPPRLQILERFEIMSAAEKIAMHQLSK